MLRLTILLPLLWMLLSGSLTQAHSLTMRVASQGLLRAPDGALFTLSLDARQTTLGAAGFLDFGGAPGRFSGSTLRNLRLLSRTSAIVQIEGRWSSLTTPRDGIVAVMSVLVEQVGRGRIWAEVRDSVGRTLYTFGRNADGSLRMGTMATGGTQVYWLL